MTKAISKAALLLAVVTYSANVVPGASAAPAKGSGGGGENVAGQLIGHPFKLVKATCNNTTLTLDGGDANPGDPSKGRNKIVIQFPSAQDFANQTYQVPYNGQKAMLVKGETRAPKVIYSGVDKDGNAVTRSAVNNSTADELDYAMELKFSPATKPGEMSGHIKLQIGTNPVTDLRGDFDVIH